MSSPVQTSIKIHTVSTISFYLFTPSLSLENPSLKWSQLVFVTPSVLSTRESKLEHLAMWTLRKAFGRYIFSLSWLVLMSWQLACRHTRWDIPTLKMSSWVRGAVMHPYLLMSESGDFIQGKYLISEKWVLLAGNGMLWGYCRGNCWDLWNLWLMPWDTSLWDVDSPFWFTSTPPQSKSFPPPVMRQWGYLGGSMCMSDACA